MLQKKESPKKAKGVYLVKKWVQIETRPTWAFQDVPPEGGCFWSKQPSGERGGKLLPYFPINRGRSEGEKCSALLVFRDHLNLVKKIISMKKIQVETLP